MSPTLDTIAIDAVPSTTPLKVASDSSDITYATVTVSELASTFGDYTGKFNSPHRKYLDNKSPTDFNIILCDF